MKRSLSIRRFSELGPLPKSKATVSFDGGIFWIREAYLYPIEASRITDMRDILAWVRHLSRKPWATPGLIAEFIDVVAEVKGIKTRITK